MMSKQEERGGPRIPTLLSIGREPSWLTLPVVLAQKSLAPASAQPQDSPPGPYDSRSMAIIMAIVVIVFFISGFLSLYTRQCAQRRNRFRGRLGSARTTSHTHPARGVDPDVIRTFPTFLYSTVKGRGTLACAVCLNEYEDDETLRLIPKCSHVFHPDCIDAWLGSHSTCPVCRANLQLPAAQGDTRFVALEIPGGAVGVSDDGNPERHVESPKVNLLSRSRTMNENHGPRRSRSTGFPMAILFPRSHSTGHADTVVEPGEDWERFTLRLEELNPSSRLKRTKSCVTFTRMSSGRKGYRTRSVGSARGSNYLQYERLTSNKPAASSHGQYNVVEVDEASSDSLYLSHS